MSPIGDWYVGNDGRWRYDRNAPSPNVEATSMMPSVPDRGEDFDEVYEREDGSIYGRVDRDLFESFDEVDSTTIVDRGAP